MNLFVKASLFLITLSCISSCAKKINPTLKRRAIISAKIEPLYSTPIEIANSFELGLKMVLNNGKTKSNYNKHDYLNKKFTNEKSDNTLNAIESYWDNFHVLTYNCTFLNGRIYFNKYNIRSQSNFIAVKITSKNELATDSIYIKLPVVTKINIEYKTNATLSPNFAIPFYISAYYDNGKVLTISDKGRYETFSANYKVYIQNNLIPYPYIYNIPLLSDLQKSFSVKCYHLSDTLLKDSITIPLKYDGHYRFLYKGSKGQNGDNGSDAYRRLHNRNGENGRRGQNGERGSHAPRVNLLLKSMYVDSNLFIKAIAYSNGIVNTCVFDPKLGRLTLSNVGGDGGNGGDGGQGANGENQTEGYAAGNGGSGGEGGQGGDGNKGGSIKVYSDSTASLYLSRIELLNPGGYGGSGGRGGRNGLSGNEKNSSFTSFMAQSLLKSIFPGSGPSGMNGYSGENGEEPTFEIVSKKRIEQMEEQIRDSKN